MELKEAFASELCGRQVELLTGTQRSRIGRIDDIAVAGSESFPPVVGFYVKGADGVVRYAPFSTIVSITDHAVTLGAPPIEGTSAPVAIDELLLQKELLDKQIVDVDGRKVVRVNDVKLAPAGDHLRVIAADVGLPGLFRRLGLRYLGDRLLDRVPAPGVRSALISWDAVQPLHLEGPGEALRLRVPQDKIDRIHPADLAAIIEDLAASDQASLIGSLDEETAAYPEIRRGEIIEGTVVGTDRDGILVDIGAKSEGVIPPHEMQCLQPEGPSRLRAASRWSAPAPATRSF